MPGLKHFHTLQLQQTGDETGDPPGRYRFARCGIPNSTGSLINPNLGFVDLTLPGEDKVSSPHQSFHTSTTSSNWGENGGSPGRYRPCGLETPIALAAC